MTNRDRLNETFKELHAFVDVVVAQLDEMTELEDPMGALVSERLGAGEFDEYVEEFADGGADEVAASALVDFLVDLVHWNPEPVPDGNHVLRAPARDVVRRARG